MSEADEAMVERVAIELAGLLGPGWGKMPWDVDRRHACRYEGYSYEAHTRDDMMIAARAALNTFRGGPLTGGSRPDNIGNADTIAPWTAPPWNPPHIMLRKRDDGQVRGGARGKPPA